MLGTCQVHDPGSVVLQSNADDLVCRRKVCDRHVGQAVTEDEDARVEHANIHLLDFLDVACISLISAKAHVDARM